VRIEIDTAAMERGVRQLVALMDGATLPQAMGLAGAKIAATIQETRFGPYQAGKRGGDGAPLMRRTGTLIRSIRAERERDGSVAVGVHGVRYARAQEFGGTIKPTRRKFLTIPLDAAYTGGGVARQSAKLVQRGNEWHTSGRVPGASGTRTFIAKGVIFVEGAGGQPVPLYALKRSVTLRPRLRFFATAAAQIPDATMRMGEGMDAIAQQWGAMS
jgi:hypothetical protein